MEWFLQLLQWILYILAIISRALARPFKRTTSGLPTTVSPSPPSIPSFIQPYDQYLADTVLRQFVWECGPARASRIARNGLAAQLALPASVDVGPSSSTSPFGPSHESSEPTGVQGGLVPSRPDSSSSSPSSPASSISTPAIIVSDTNEKVVHLALPPRTYATRERISAKSEPVVIARGIRQEAIDLAKPGIGRGISIPVKVVLPAEKSPFSTYGESFFVDEEPSNVVDVHNVDIYIESDPCAGEVPSHRRQDMHLDLGSIKYPTNVYDGPLLVVAAQNTKKPGVAELGRKPFETPSCRKTSLATPKKDAVVTVEEDTCSRSASSLASAFSLNRNSPSSVPLNGGSSKSTIPSAPPLSWKERKERQAARSRSIKLKLSSGLDDIELNLEDSVFVDGLGNLGSGCSRKRPKPTIDDVSFDLPSNDSIRCSSSEAAHLGAPFVKATRNRRLAQVLGIIPWDDDDIRGATSSFADLPRSEPTTHQKVAAVIQPTTPVRTTDPGIPSSSVLALPALTVVTPENQTSWVDLSDSSVSSPVSAPSSSFDGDVTEPFSPTTEDSGFDDSQRMVFQDGKDDEDSLGNDPGLLDAQISENFDNSRSRRISVFGGIPYKRDSVALQTSTTTQGLGLSRDRTTEDMRRRLLASRRQPIRRISALRPLVLPARLAQRASLVATDTVPATVNDTPGVSDTSIISCRSILGPPPSLPLPELPATGSSSSLSSSASSYSTKSSSRPTGIFIPKREPFNSSEAPNKHGKGRWKALLELFKEVDPVNSPDGESICMSPDAPSTSASSTQSWDEHPEALGKVSQSSVDS